MEFIRSRYDRDVDENSINPQQLFENQLFEKMLSGMYLGELVARLVLVNLATNGLVFNGVVNDQLQTRHSFFTKFVSEIELEAENSVTAVREILLEFGYETPTDEDCVTVWYVCKCISRRAHT